MALVALMVLKYIFSIAFISTTYMNKYSKLCRSCSGLRLESIPSNLMYYFKALCYVMDMIFATLHTLCYIFAKTLIQSWSLELREKNLEQRFNANQFWGKLPKKYLKNVTYLLLRMNGFHYVFFSVLTDSFIYSFENPDNISCRFP